MPQPPVKKSRLQLGGKAGVALAVANEAHEYFGKARAYWRDNFAYTVVVSEKDPLYQVVHDWLVSATPLEKHRSLEAVTTDRRRESYPMESSDQEREVKPPPLKARFNTKTTRNMLISGHRVAVSVLTPDVGPSNIDREPEPSRIEFRASSYEAQQAVWAQLEKLNDTRTTTRKAVLKMVGQWGGWRTRSDLPPRTMESISLPAEQKLRLLKDLGGFLEDEDKYNRLAIPWHRGYMFHGPPGTGKTSLVKALAHEFNLDLWYVSLADLKAESGLLQLLAEVGPRSLLLLEDIDTMKITHDRDASDQGTISMSSLLNTLDGVATPHGLITIMTTNRFDILDPALTRAGRMDVVELLDYPSLRTIKDMYEHFYGPYQGVMWGAWEDLDKPIEGLSTSTVSEIFKRHLDDPAGGAEELFTKAWAARKPADG